MEGGSEYAWSTFHGDLKEPPVLNIPGLRICEGYEYMRVTQRAEYVLSKPEYALIIFQYA